jgi:hypothetical protein
LGKEGDWDARVPGSVHLFQALGMLTASLCFVFSLSAYDCDFFNKGKTIILKWNVRGQGTARPILMPRQHWAS